MRESEWEKNVAFTHSHFSSVASARFSKCDSFLRPARAKIHYVHSSAGFDAEALAEADMETADLLADGLGGALGTRPTVGRSGDEQFRHVAN